MNCSSYMIHTSHTIKFSRYLKKMLHIIHIPIIIIKNTFKHYKTYCNISPTFQVSIKLHQIEFMCMEMNCPCKLSLMLLLFNYLPRCLSATFKSPQDAVDIACIYIYIYMKYGFYVYRLFIS